MSNVSSITPISIEDKKIFIKIQSLWDLSNTKEEHIMIDLIHNEDTLVFYIIPHAPWYKYIYVYLKNSIIHEVFERISQKEIIERIVVRHALIGDVIYKISFDDTLIRFLIEEEDE